MHPQSTLTWALCPRTDLCAFVMLMLVTALLTRAGTLAAPQPSKTLPEPQGCQLGQVQSLSPQELQAFKRAKDALVSVTVPLAPPCQALALGAEKRPLPWNPNPWAWPCSLGDLPSSLQEDMLLLKAWNCSAILFPSTRDLRKLQVSWAHCPSCSPLAPGVPLSTRTCPAWSQGALSSPPCCSLPSPPRPSPVSVPASPQASVLLSPQVWERPVALQAELALTLDVLGALSESSLGPILARPLRMLQHIHAQLQACVSVGRPGLLSCPHLYPGHTSHSLLGPQVPPQPTGSPQAQGHLHHWLQRLQEAPHKVSEQEGPWGGVVAGDPQTAAPLTLPLPLLGVPGLPGSFCDPQPQPPPHLGPAMCGPWSTVCLSLG